MRKTLLTLMAAAGLITAASPALASSYKLMPNYNSPGGWLIYNSQGTAIVASITRIAMAGGAYQTVVNDPSNILHISYNSNAQIVSFEVD